MHIHSLTMKNIGPYYGRNSLDLTVEPNKDRNIVLIGGNNGSGKTTLLNAIKIALFGPQAYGFTTKSVTYNKMIRDLLNKKAVQQNEDQYYIQISYETVEQYEKKHYELHREWTLEKNDVKESFWVYCNNHLLNEEDTENFVNQLKINVSPSLVNSFMFDGEKVARIIERDDLSSFLRSVFYDVFNFNLIQEFQSDVKKFLDKAKTQANLTNDEVEMLSAQHELKSIKNQLRLKNQYLSERKNERHTRQIKIKELLKRFKNLGGLTEKELRSVKKEFDNLERTRQKTQKEIKEYLESDYPFAINHRLVNKTLRNFRDEYPFKLANTITKMKKQDVIPKNITDNLSSFLDEYTDENSRDLLFSNFSDDLMYRLDQLIEKRIKPNRPQKYLKKFEKTSALLVDEMEFKSRFNHAENADELNALIEEITALQNDASNIEAQIEELEAKKEDLEDAYEKCNNRVETLEKNIFSTTKQTNSFALAQRILKLNEDYVARQTEEQIKSVEKLALTNFQTVTSKKSFIGKIQIDPDSFDVTLYDNEGVPHSRDYLSAGEKQVLISSIISAMFDLSQRRLMFVFDTPLARLDQDNRRSFTKRIIRNSSKQVIVLSTDEEVTGSVLESIAPNIQNTYLLQSINANETKVREGYFEKVKS